MIRNKKKLICFVAILLVALSLLGGSIYMALSPTAPKQASADATVGDRIEMIDLWERYPIRVIGPLAAKNDAGQYVDAAGNRVKDKYGEYTNNIYQIPADQYFNVENYIFTKPNTDDIGGGKTGRTLYGWKPDIEPVDPRTGAINEDGYILADNNPTSTVGMYVRYNPGFTYGTLEKYALIVPDDVTVVGKGNGAYAYKGKTYYGSSGTPGSISNGLKTSDTASEFTDFGGFIFNHASGSFDSNDYYLPRERLAGVYFSKDSRLHTIEGGTDATDAVMNVTSRSGANFNGKAAFAYCDNMRFFILPEGVKTIGQSAFYKCSQLVDVNIPEAVGGTDGSLGKNAFFDCKSLLHITVPSGVTKNENVFANCTKLKDVENLSTNFVEADFVNNVGADTTATLFNYQTVANKSALYVVGGEPTYENGEKVYEPGLDGFIFCKNVKGNPSTFATIDGYNQTYQKDKWYAIGISGDPDTNGEKVYVFPSEFDDGCDRRQGIKYDYIDASGHKCKNSITTPQVQNYDIAKDFAKDTWCVNIVMPSAIKVIGDNAFNGSHTRYMETYATHIGTGAFYSNKDVASNQGNAQWYYLHQTGSYQAYRVGTNAFSDGPFNYHRYFIFEDNALYTLARANGSALLTYINATYAITKYQIPVYVNVHSADGAQFTVPQSNMAEKFYNDSDFGDVTIQANANNKIVISKRLNGYGYTTQKQATGYWATNDTENQTYPTLSNMISTVWYSDENYTNKISNTGLGIGQSYSNSMTALNVYTRIVGAPNLSDQTYQYNVDVSASKDMSFNKAVKLETETSVSDLYVAGDTADFTYFGGNSSSKVNVVQNAGTYVIPILLHPKWGEWDTSKHNYSVKVTVNRAEFDMGNLDNLPRFSVDGGADLGGTGEGTTIYQYPDGWYQYPTEKTASDSKVVLNSYVRHTGSPITIAGRPSDDSIYKVIRSGGFMQTDSDSYLGSFSLEMTNRNYVFSTASYEKNVTEFQKYGIVFIDDSEMTDDTPRLHITKRWYIVIQTNWLIDKDAPDISTPYVLLTYNDVSTATLPYEATFKLSDDTTETDKYVVHIPKLARGTTTQAITFTMTYGSAETPITAQEIDVSNLANYVNSAMPAGTYTITISAPEVADPDDNSKNLPAVRDIIRLTVTPKPISANAILARLGKNQEMSFEHAFVANQVNLYDATTATNLTSLIDDLKNGVGINTERKKDTAGIWKQTDFDRYYDDVAISYNLDRMRTTTYYQDLANFADRTLVPQEVGKYIVYYSLSAKNYQSVGGANADDRRDYRFNTIIYRELSLDEIANTIQATGSTPYPYVYNGGVINANVPYSAFYTYTFGGDRTNATKSTSTNKPTVTLTITDSELTRWKSASVDGVSVVDDGKVATVTYTIQQATNYWRSQPQVPGWSYKGFTPEVHTFIGTLAFTQSPATVQYRIGTANIDGNNNIQYNDPESPYFTVNTNGVLEDDADKTIQNILNALNVLPSGQFYYLEYDVSDTEDGNVKGTTGRSDFRIYLTKAQNSWTTTPALTPFQYTQFNYDFIAGVPLYSTAASVVYKIGNTELHTVYDEVSKEYKLDDDAIAVLNALTVNSYRIDVTLEGDTNYNAMTPYQIPFSVMQSQSNPWIEGAVEEGDTTVTYSIPNISNWTYGGYVESLLTKSKAQFGTVSYTVKTADDNMNAIDNVPGFIGLSYDQLQAKLKTLADTLNAGNYRLYATSEGTTPEDKANFVAATRDVGFRVARAQNEWDTTPDIEGWTYGETANIPNPTLGTAKFEAGEATVTCKYYTARYANGSWAQLDEVSSADIATANAGDYVYVTTVEETTNYLKLEQSVHFEIERAQNNWATDCEPEGTFTWTWGKTADVLSVNSGFVKAAAVQMTTEKEVTYMISGAAISLQTVTKKTVGTTTVLTVGKETFDGTLVDYMKQLGVGNYQVTTSVKETANFAGVNKVTYVTVNPATFEWQTAPADSSWTWGDSAKPFTEPKIVPVTDSGVKISYKVGVTGSGSTTYDTTVGGKTPFQQVCEYLRDENTTAATYNVEVSVSCENYTTLTKAVKVEIKLATNVWSSNAPATDLFKQHDTSLSIAKAVPKFGEAEYSYLSGDTNVTTKNIDTVNEWIRYLPASANAYLITVTVPSATGKYTGLTAVTRLTVAGTLLSWDNQSSLKPSYEYTYGEAFNNATAGTILVPTYTPGVTGTKSYSVVFNDGNAVSITPADAATVLSYLKENEKAGTFTITASYEPTDKNNYSMQPYVITVKVNPGAAKWGKTILPEYINPYQAVEMPTPSANYPVTLTIKDNDGKTLKQSTISEFPSTELEDYLNGLDAGTYKVYSEVKGSANYTGLSEVETRVVILPITNNWKDASVLQPVWEYKRLETFNIVVPEALRGTVRYVVNGTPLANNVDLNNYLNANKDTFKANATTYADYPLSFVVDEDENGNYNGLQYDCAIRISKNTNEWENNQAPIATYNWTGRVSDAGNVQFRIPVAHHESGLLHFDIRKNTGPATVSSSFDLNEVEFLKALAELVNGTYTVTMRIGGSCANDDHKTDEFASNKERLDAYNDNYYQLVGTSTIYISPKANKWNDDLVADSTVTWTYAATDNDPVNFIPENSEGMVIRVNSDRITLPEGKTLNAYLTENYGYGTYLVRAIVPANNVYTSLDKSITLEINKSDANDWETRVIPNESSVYMCLKLNSSWIWDIVRRNEHGEDERPTQEWASLGFVAPVPIFGNRVAVTVRSKAGDDLFTVTLTYDLNADEVKTVNENDYNLLRNRLGALDVGEYTATAVIPELDNYNAYTQPAVAFEITQANNGWSAEPAITGWSFNGETAYPSSQPKYGNANDVVYSYAPILQSDAEAEADKATCLAHVSSVPESAWQSGLPLNAGRYYIRGTLAETDNYKELVGHNVFAIGAGANAWVAQPGVIAWRWNNYNREVNQFSASARNGGEITFAIMKEDSSSATKYSYVLPSDFRAYNGTTFSQLTLDQVKVVYSFGFTEGKMISQTVADVLNALLPGTYYLHAEAGYANNVDGIYDSYVQFKVDKANNEWITAPNVLSYGYNDFISEGDRMSLTAGDAKYGTVNYKVTNSKGDVVVTSAAYSASTLATKLSALPVDNYVLRAWVPSENADVYNSFFTESDANPYRILFSVTRTTQNGWLPAPDGEDEGYYAPKTPLSELYINLHKSGFDFGTWFGNPKTADLNAKITYQLLKTDLTPAIAGSYAYGDLFNAIKLLDSGEYVVRLSAESKNYLDMTFDIILNINRQTFGFVLDNNITGQWRKDLEGNYLTYVEDLDFTFFAGADATFTLENVPYTSFSALQTAIRENKFDANVYQIAVNVKETNEYFGFNGTVRLEIKQDDNEWRDSWDITNSLGISTTFDATSAISWTYGTNIDWVGAQPKYGTIVYVDIRRTGASEAFSYTDVNYADPVAAQSAINNISRVLSTLDGGEYTLTVLAPADTNWKQKSDSVSFTITRATNDWKTDKEPTLDGAVLNAQGVLSYVYDKLAISPKAEALHGDTAFIYYADGSTTPLKATPVNAGKYRVEFVVTETDNYEGLSESLSFVIAKDTDQSFIVSNGTVGWIYGEYDRLTHVFTGIPRTGGEVSYVVLDSTGKEVITGIILGDSDGVHHSDFDKDTYVSVADAAKVGALLAGDYRLKIVVAEMPNYEGFSATSPFKVSPTQNYWTVTPKITPWSIDLYKESENLPVAESRFGSPVIKIVSRNNNEVFYEATYNRTAGKYDIAINRLEDAPAGMYTMTAKVNSAPGMYLNPLEETVSLEVYKRGFGEVKNVWYDTPGINPWEANILQIVNTPYGTPLRGLPYFEFYHSKRDADNQIVIDWENPVKAGEDSFFVAKGKSYFKDFYIPMAPGYYYMVACAESLDGEGNIIAADTLREAPVQFQIYNRENSFKEEPRIETLLFLGDRISWAQPTAEPRLLDSTLTFKYKNAATGEDLGSVMPTEAGRYIVTAYAKAKYSELIEKSVEFVVELSNNAWVDLPAIDDWTEEYSATAPDPTASALYGSENIVYTYENLATGEITTEKPLEEGNYRLIATVKVPGYKDLVGSSYFTVGPAFDFDLLVVDIVLATVCCGLTIWIIALAIKKRNEL